MTLALLILLVQAVAVQANPAPSAPSAPPAVTVPTAVLPTARVGASSVSDGAGNAYVFGGSDGTNYLNTIVRYTPGTNAVTTMSTTLPAGRAYASAAWDGTSAYIFGGEGSSGKLGDIVRYTPSTNTVLTLSATLTTARSGTSAVWDGYFNFYVFGGSDLTGDLNQILQYKRSTNAISLMTAVLPTGRSGTSAVWDANGVSGINGVGFIFGGSDITGNLDDILQFNPVGPSIFTMDEILPTPRRGTSAAWDGAGHAYVFGGTGAGGSLDEIVRFSHVKHQDHFNPSWWLFDIDADRLPDRLPTARTGTSAAWIGGKAYVFGGSGSAGLISGMAAFAPNRGLSATSPLPTSNADTSAVWDGAGNAYVFGGYTTANGDKVVKFTPATGLASTLASTLPVAAADTTAVADGAGNAYIFGGYTNGGPSSQILRFTFATETVTTMGATLPSVRYGASAVWDGAGNAYVFGGHTGAGFSNQVVRYTPATGTVQPMSAALPAGLAHASAVWDGAGNAYIFGGTTIGTNEVTQILRYTPATDTMATLPETLPKRLSHTSAVWNGAGNAYIFGGDSSIFQETLLRYTPSTGSVAVMSAVLPTPRMDTSAVWDGFANAYVFAGRDNTAAYAYLPQVVKFSPYVSPTPPQGVAAAGGPAVGQITVTWQAPADNGGKPVTGYSVYRSDSPGSESLVATLGAVLSYTDSGLGNGVTRYYKVSASNGVGESAASSGAAGTTFNVPNAPSLTAAGGPGAGQIRLTWTAPYNGGLAITSYKVYGGSTSGGEALLTNGGCANLGNVLTCTDSGHGDGATRYYKVRAVNALGDSPDSNEASATTFGPPSAPQGLQATPDPVGQKVKLTWQPPANLGGTPITGYKIYKGTSPGAEAWLTDVGNVLTWSDNACRVGTTCYYQVSAVNLVGQGPRSSEVFSPGTDV